MDNSNNNRKKRISLAQRKAIISAQKRRKLDEFTPFSGNSSTSSCSTSSLVRSTSRRPNNNKPLLVRLAQDSLEKRIRKAALMVLLAVFLFRMSSRLLERKKFSIFNAANISPHQKPQTLIAGGESSPALFHLLNSQQLPPQIQDTSETDPLEKVLDEESSSITSITCNIPFTCWSHKHRPNTRLTSKMLDDLLNNMLQ